MLGGKADACQAARSCRLGCLGGLLAGFFGSFEPLSGGPLARDVLAVTYAAYLSAAEGRRVELAPYLR